VGGMSDEQENIWVNNYLLVSQKVFLPRKSVVMLNPKNEKGYIGTLLRIEPCFFFLKT